MEDTIESILVEAARTKQRKESVERAVGRAVRRMGKDYSVYIAAMSELRELASSTKTTVDEALEKLQEREQE
ncbi:MAG: hypothetical protein JSU93_06045 [Methanobacteriota archaeon]|nr:MAG: hypothetical protein JSU93_06045 [Euryarchaeota archaeon]